MATLEKLTVNDLVRILTEPKNALIKQYQYLLGLDNVDLVFEEDSLEAIAQVAIERNTGARGLRAIVEQVMLDVMFQIPSLKNINKCIISKENILNHTKPILLDKKGKVIKF